MPQPNKSFPGQKIGLLTLIRSESRSHACWWLCRCECGTEKWMAAGNIRKSVSCGCVRASLLRSGVLRRTHGLKHTPEYQAWSGAISRCENPNADSYKYYGAVGIRMCATWRGSFVDFLRDMGPRPTSSHSLERVNCFGDYEPGNCIWANRLEQNHNRRTSVFVDAFGEHLHLTDVAIRFGRNRHTLYSRLFQYGWEPERALTTPPRKRGHP